MDGNLPGIGPIPKIGIGRIGTIGTIGVDQGIQQLFPRFFLPLEHLFQLVLLDGAVNKAHFQIGIHPAGVDVGGFSVGAHGFLARFYGKQGHIFAAQAFFQGDAAAVGVCCPHAQRRKADQGRFRQIPICTAVKNAPFPQSGDPGRFSGIVADHKGSIVGRYGQRSQQGIKDDEGDDPRGHHRRPIPTEAQPGILKIAPGFGCRGSIPRVRLPDKTEFFPGDAIKLCFHIISPPFEYADRSIRS